MLNELFVIYVSSADHKNRQNIFQQVLSSHKKKIFSINCTSAYNSAMMFSFIRYLISGVLVNLLYFCLWFVMKNFDMSLLITDPQS